LSGDETPWQGLHPTNFDWCGFEEAEHLDCVSRLGFEETNELQFSKEDAPLYPAPRFKYEDERGFSSTMATDISERVREIAHARDLPESAVVEQALERGIEGLWRDVTLSSYFEGELDREQAVERVGRTTVERAEREREVVEEDIDWGLNA
jgi:predicted transcriptional regulator